MSEIDYQALRAKAEKATCGVWSLEYGESRFDGDDALIHRSKQSPIGRRACDVALAAHLQTYGDYGRSKMKETYTVKVEGVKVWVEVVNRKASYVATAMTGMRRLRSLPGQVG